MKFDTEIFYLHAHCPAHLIEMFANSCRKIIAIGRNFADHAKELGNPVPTKPMFFLKPPSSIVLSPGRIEIPPNIDVHHELELGVVIGKNGRNIRATDAMNYVSGYCLGLDLTARNIQNEAKAKGNPWSEAKGYDTFTPLGDFIERSKITDPMNLQLKLRVDNEIRQDGNTRDMIFDIAVLIEYISKIMKLEKNDLILTGTPKGVGPILPGQMVVGQLLDKERLLSEIEFRAIPREY
jgi:acylpyruvate hydrolase